MDPLGIFLDPCRVLFEAHVADVQIRVDVVDPRRSRAELGSGRDQLFVVLVVLELFTDRRGDRRQCMTFGLHGRPVGEEHHGQVLVVADR
ncbi:hypothetical protein ABTX77_41660, partial [Streptomyces sp. NPDC097704]|uniref:hypothetical protein n=1 Tax=Streptomyces sp. NPDC097704 TaxID=3157101 RepID=UPI0033313A67